MMRSLAVLLGLNLVAVAAHAEFIQGSDIQYGNWSGGAYSYDDTGDFSHCAVSAEYLSGDTLIFTVNSDVSVSVAVVSPGLNLTEGQTFPVTLYVDRRRPFNATATALDHNFAALKIPEFDLAMAAFQRGRTLYVESPAGSATYDLTGTFRALDAARNCAGRYYRYAGTISENPVPSTPTTDRTVLFQIATEMISETGVSDFRYLDANETQEIFKGDAVFWSSEAQGIFGGVLSVPYGAATSLKQSDAADIAFVTGDCVGELATTTRSVPLPDLEAREIRALCVTNESQVESMLTKVLVGDLVLYTLLTFNGDSVAQTPESRKSLSEDVAIRAVNYIKNAEPAE